MSEPSTRIEQAIAVATKAHEGQLRKKTQRIPFDS